MIYLDNNATTRVAPEVVAAMLPHFSESYHNPASIAGEVVGIKTMISRARRIIAHLVGAFDHSSIVFTSGATESNNWVAHFVAETRSEPGHLVASAIEHPSVIEPLRRLEKKGWRLTLIPVDKRGVVDQRAMRDALCGDTALVSLMAANNETGVVQPITEIAALVKAKVPAAYFHTDATQMAGKLPMLFDDDWADVDFVSISGHKFHGPKGIGALIFRAELEIAPLLLGGGQEEGRRSGTLNIPGIVGMATAADLTNAELEKNGASIAFLRDGFEQNLKATFPDVVVHGLAARRLPNTSCFSLPRFDANHLAEILASDGICVGTGSACSSGALHPPRTLLEMGVDYEMAAAALRVSLSRYSTAEELATLVRHLSMLRQSFATYVTTGR